MFCALGLVKSGLLLLSEADALEISSDLLLSPTTLPDRSRKILRQIVCRPHNTCLDADHTNL